MRNVGVHRSERTCVESTRVNTRLRIGPCWRASWQQQERTWCTGLCIGTRRRAGGQQVQVWWYWTPGGTGSQFESKVRTHASFGPGLHGAAAVLRWWVSTDQVVLPWRLWRQGQCDPARWALRDPGRRGRYSSGIVTPSAGPRSCGALECCGRRAPVVVT